MPRILGRLWRSGGRRVDIAEAPAGPEAAPVSHQAEADPGELERRLEAARARLRDAIPPPEEDGSAQ